MHEHVVLVRRELLEVAVADFVDLLVAQLAVAVRVDDLEEQVDLGV